jgi:hypothetical protein
MVLGRSDTGVRTFIACGSRNGGNLYSVPFILMFYVPNFSTKMFIYLI